MPDDQTHRHHPSGADRAAVTEIAEQWSRLRPDEQDLVVLAIDALADGRLTSRTAWGQFVAASIKLLEALDVHAPADAPDEDRPSVT